jgi:outer membrane protein assembly factor BamB
LWKTGLGRVEGSPVFAGENLYLAATDSLFQLDFGGRSQWRIALGQQLGSPAFDTQRIYSGTDTGVLQAISRKSGKGVWKFTTDENSAIYTTPELGDGRVYVEATDGNVYALDAAGGQLRWKFLRPDGSLGYSSPVFADGSLYICGETTLYRLNPRNGEVIWQKYIGGKSLSTVAIGGGRLFVGGDGTGLTAHSLGDGSILWTFVGRIKNDWFGSPTVTNGMIYVSTYNRYVYGIDANTGGGKWSLQVPGSALSTPAVDTKRSVVYVTSTTYKDNPTLTAIDGKTGKKLWDYKLGHTTGSPIIVGDTLYVGSTTGTLYAFSLK